MTTPTIYPTGYAGDDTDYLKAKVDKSGAVRHIRETVTLTAGSTVGTVIGITPFQAGFKVHPGSYVYVTGASTGTFDIGYVYDSTAATDDSDAFVDGSTVIASGGFISFATTGSTAGIQFISTANGWVVTVPQTSGISTSGNGTLYADLITSYDIKNF